MIIKYTVSCILLCAMALSILLEVDKMEWYNGPAAMLAGVAGLFSTIIGGYDTLFECFLILMVLDILCGIISCVVFGKSRKTTGGLSSEVLVMGGARKICEIFVVCVAVMVDYTLGMDYVRNAVVLYFIATEAISILEHIGNMGVPLPAFILNLLEVLKNKSDKGE